MNSHCYIKRLYLRNFRNFSEAEAVFSPRLNILHGENAQGKTNLLEAIYLIATGRSFRAERLQDLIKQGEKFFFLDAQIIKDGIEHSVQITFDGITKKLILNQNQYGLLQHLIGLLPSVLFTPYDAELIDGSPAMRRRFLNLHLAQSNPLYIHHLSRYIRAMKQRNAQLKTKQMTGIECWEAEMAHSATYILQSRLKLMDSLHGPFKYFGQTLSGKTELHELRFYPAHPPSVNAYQAQLVKNRVRDEMLGSTQSGPHRDDFSIFIDSKQACDFASEGQKKTAISALKFSDWQQLTEQIGVPALFGIDDLGLNLDEKRQELLRSKLGEMGQIFVTMPQLLASWNQNANPTSFMIAAGSIS